jgi:RNA recognition motif-containing protein
MGFGFVEYRKPEHAQKALRQLQVNGDSRLRFMEIPGRWRGGTSPRFPGFITFLGAHVQLTSLTPPWSFISSITFVGLVCTRHWAEPGGDPSTLW